jgi:uncharacterized OsmC-like protein
MKTVPELVEITKKVVAERASSKGQGQGTLRVDVKHRHQKTLEAAFKTESGEITFLIDEPRGRGGLGEGGNPLGYFLAGAGGCLLMQYVSLAIAEDLPIETLSMIVRGHILRQVPCHFQDIVYDIFIEGSVSEEQVERLVEEASHHCFVDNTLPKAMPVKTVIHLNDKEVLTRSRGPGD